MKARALLIVLSIVISLAVAFAYGGTAAFARMAQLRRGRLPRGLR